MSLFLHNDAFAPEIAANQMVLLVNGEDSFPDWWVNENLPLATTISLPSGLHSSQDLSDIVVDRTAWWSPSRAISSLAISS